MLQQKSNSSSSELEKSDKKNIRQLKQLFSSSAKSLPKLVSSTGEEVVLSEAVYNTLYEVLEAMESGTEITVSPLNQNITVSEAAEILNVSSSYVNKLLDRGDISCVNSGTAKHINRRELLIYKEQRDIERRKALSEFTSSLQENGFYS